MLVQNGELLTVERERQSTAASRSHFMDLILLGAPGAGKGTQGAILAERLGITRIATGDLLRAAGRAGTEHGRMANALMDAGKLVPDELITGLVEDVLSQPGAMPGAIFDGYPRTVRQAEALFRMLEARGRRVDAVLAIEVDDAIIVRRLSGRRTDPETGLVYHVENNPPPPEVVPRLVHREDDRPETIQKRLQEYHEKTQPLIEFYERAGVPMFRIDGDRPIEMVQADIMQRLEP